MSNAMRIPAARLVRFAQDALEAVAVDSDNAARVAGILVAADAQGTHSHGTVYLPRYVRGIAQGHITANPVMRWRPSAAPAVAHLDGGGGLGHLACSKAMSKCTALAKDYGIGAVSVTSSNHFGPAGIYAGKAAEEDMIGWVTTSSPAVMAPTGGGLPVIGNNPVAFAMPGSRGYPIMLDMACSEVARGRIRSLAATSPSRPIPSTWAVNAEGEPLRDAAAALTGALMPVGAHKGYGLAFVNEILSGVLSGSPSGADIPSPILEEGSVMGGTGVGHWVMAIAIEAFCSMEEYLPRIEHLIDMVKSSARGEDSVMVPGEPEFIHRKDSDEFGIALSNSTISSLRQLAMELGVDRSL